MMMGIWAERKYMTLIIWNRSLILGLVPTYPIKHILNWIDDILRQGNPRQSISTNCFILKPHEELSFSAWPWTQSLHYCTCKTCWYSNKQVNDEWAIPNKQSHDLSLLTHFYMSRKLKKRQRRNITQTYMSNKPLALFSLFLTNPR